MDSTNDILLLGPPNVGKTTVAAQLARTLGRDHHELDRMRRDYFEALGFDMAFNLRLFEEQGPHAMYQYWGVFAPAALERFLAEHSGILDLGGGTPVAWYPPLRARIRETLEPYAHVVALLPDPDVEVALSILGARAETPPSLAESQRYLMETRMYEALATHRVYTGDRSANEVTAEVLERLGRPPSQALP